MLAFLTHLLLKGFTFMSMCGMNQGLTSVRILLSLSPPITPIRALALTSKNRTLVGPLVQPLSKQTSQRLIPLHTLSRTAESQLPLILSYVPPCRQLLPSQEKYADIRQAHDNQHHLSCPANARDSVMTLALADQVLDRYCWFIQLGSLKCVLEPVFEF
jgi:hypothetical protein